MNCLKCDGNGLMRQLRFDMYGQVFEEVRMCNSCYGTGKSKEDTVGNNGVKFDNGKPELSLLFSFGQVLDAVVAVCKYGAKKYPDMTNWQRVERGEQRYLDACLRHLRQHLQNEPPDAESGLPHIYHFAWNALAATWHAMQRVK